MYFFFTFIFIVIICYIAAKIIKLGVTCYNIVPFKTILERIESFALKAILFGFVAEI
jgi:hypothetical protein